MGEDRKVAVEFQTWGGLVRLLGRAAGAGASDRKSGLGLCSRQELVSKYSINAPCTPRGRPAWSTVESAQLTP